MVRLGMTDFGGTLETRCHAYLCYKMLLWTTGQRSHRMTMDMSTSAIGAAPDFEIF